jgi:TRAP-type C4-dicarboxylate transport system permease small subunit
MNASVIRALERLDRALIFVLKWICIALFAGMTAILALNVFIRFVPLMSMHWFDEILELLYGALIFYGAAAVWVTHSHFSVGDWISKYLRSVRARFAYRLVVELLSLLFAVVFFKYALDITMRTQELTPAFAMSKKWLYACMPITGIVMILYSLKNMYLELAKIVNPALDIGGGPEPLNH